MITASKWTEGWLLLVGGFGGHMKSEAAEATYALVLRPIMDDETWARTVLAVLHRGGDEPRISTLIREADLARLPGKPRPSEVAEAREDWPAITDETFRPVLEESHRSSLTLRDAAQRVLTPAGTLIPFRRQ